MKENFENVRKEHLHYEELIASLVPGLIKIKNFSCTISYDLQLTMIDGKTCNVITNQRSSGSCNMCGALPSDMNRLNKIAEKPINEEFLKFGLSTLHCKMRFMECLLNISYNEAFKKNSCRGFKEQKSQAKKRVQTELKKHLGILVDVVKQGFGTTNTGNTARRFFNEPNKVAQILRIDRRLVKRFAVMSQVLSCDREIDVNAFKNYGLETAKLFIELYEWKFMPPTVHKVMIHGWRIIERFKGFIGKYSEEAQEATNKVFREARAHKSRQCDPIKNNLDIMHYLLESSDPKVNFFRIVKKIKHLNLCDEARKLLKNKRCRRSL